METMRHDEAQQRLGELRVALDQDKADATRRIAAFDRAEAKRRLAAPYHYTPLTEHQLARLTSYHTVRCDVCHVMTPIDDIVWRGPGRTHAVCDECAPEGDAR